MGTRRASQFADSGRPEAGAAPGPAGPRQRAGQVEPLPRWPEHGCPAPRLPGPLPCPHSCHSSALGQTHGGDAVLLGGCVLRPPHGGSRHGARSRRLHVRRRFARVWKPERQHQSCRHADTVEVTRLHLGNERRWFRSFLTLLVPSSGDP